MQGLSWSQYVKWFNAMVSNIPKGTYGFYVGRSQKRKKIVTTWLNFNAFGIYMCKRYVYKCWWNWHLMFMFDLWSSQKWIKYDIKSHFLGYFEKFKPYTYEEKVTYFICYEIFTLLSHIVLYPSMYDLWSIFLWNFQSIKFETLDQCRYQIWLTRAMHRALQIWVLIQMSCSKSFIILISELLMQLMNQTQWTSQ